LFTAVRFVFTLVAAIGAFDGERFPVIASGLPQRCAHPTPQTGSLRNSTGLDPRTQIAPLRYWLHFSEHRVTANFVGRGMPSADAVAPGSVGGSTADI
jgi:hypothetical protein